MGHHFFTTDVAEANKAMSKLKYHYEGIACYVYAVQYSTSVEFYRMYNPDKNDHFYTTDSVDRYNAAAHHGYRKEGVACYVSPDSSLEQSAPFYRLYNGEV